MKYVLAIIIIISFFSCEDNDSSFQWDEDNTPTDSVMKVIISYVYDGDTYLFYHDNSSYKIRLLNVDCFETSLNSRLEEQAHIAGISVDSALALGYKAKYYADSVLSDNEVTLYRGKYSINTDTYERLLRHVEIKGEMFDSLLKAKNLTVY